MDQSNLTKRTEGQMYQGRDMITMASEGEIDVLIRRLLVIIFLKSGRSAEQHAETQDN